MKRTAHVFLRGILLMGMLLFLPAPRAAQNTAATLLLSHQSARPGETITAALKLNHAPGWHTYWRNPGDAGFPTSIDWELPAGLSVGEIEWPVPEKMVITQLHAYVYEGEVLLLIPLQVDASLPAGTLQLKGKASWLECSDELCVPGGGSVQATIVIGPEPAPSPSADLIETWRARLPKRAPELTPIARWANPPAGEARPLVIEWQPKAAPDQPDFFPYESEGFTVLPPTKVLQCAEAVVTLQKEVEAEGAAWPSQVAGLLLDRSTGEHPTAYEVEMTIPEEPMSQVAAVGTAAAAPPAAPNPFADASLLAVLGFAFLGGLILNIMPCVLPVIALKVLSFVNQSADPRRARQFGLIYALGVLASFLVLAGFIIGVQKAQGVASWGMQFQNPVFIVALLLLVTLIGLNLFGVFEITLGSTTMGAASSLAAKEGKAGAFFHGVLATVLGTSCTAPFLFFAIGYALTQPPLITVLVFLMIGVGLAFPYVLLTWNPRLLRLLPKPGRWMERFKVAMGFPMLATAAWLFSVAVHAHFGSRGALWLGLLLVLVGFAAWIWGEFVQRGQPRRPLAMALSLGIAAFAFAFILEQQLNWRNPPPRSSGSLQIANDPDGIQWEKWSHEAVARAQQAGRPVLVDFTAVWCPNCQVNKATSIEIDSVQARLKEMNALALIGDFSGQDPVIARELQKFGRGAVPLVLVYPVGGGDPEILPPMLTPRIVLDALDRAANGPKKSTSAPPVGNVAARR